MATGFAASPCQAQAGGGMNMTSAPGATPVAVLIDQGATVIDFAGPWDAFNDCNGDDHFAGFNVFTVAPTADLVRTISGLKVAPDYTFDNAPNAKIVVVPAQGSGTNPRKLDWLRNANAHADVIMSICTGSFLLARAGLLDGKRATTHPDAYDLFASTFPRVTLVRDVSFVDEGRFVSASAGLSGVPLGLHVAKRYAGRDFVAGVAHYLGETSTDW